MKKSSIKIYFILCLIILSGCAVPLLTPQEADVSTAREHWSDASLEQLTTAHKLYKAKCGSCHFLYRPYQFNAAKWEKEIDEMSVKAKLQPAEKELIRRYLLTMCRNNPENATNTANHQ